MSTDRPPLRLASLGTSPPFDGVEEGREPSKPGAFPFPPEGGEVASRSDDGVGEDLPATRSRRKSGTTSRARKLRQGGNQAEALLWLELKAGKLGGHKFTRQFAIEPYFADFCCRKKRLVVEIDGSQHAGNTYDRRRDEFMRRQGYSILRVWSHDVLKHRTSVCETILAALDGRLTQNVDAFDLRFVFAKPAQSDSIPSFPDPTS